MEHLSIYLDALLFISSVFSSVQVLNVDQLIFVYDVDKRCDYDIFHALNTKYTKNYAPPIDFVASCLLNI